LGSNARITIIDEYENWMVGHNEDLKGYIVLILGVDITPGIGSYRETSRTAASLAGSNPTIRNPQGREHTEVERKRY
jgi:hypothetical protein